MRTGEIAAMAGCNIQTLRYYERRGLLKAPRRTRSGYREYAPETVRLIRFIKRAQELGFSLGEVEDLLKLREQQSKRRGQVRAITKAKLRDIESKLARLHAMHRALSGLLKSCASRRASPICPILSALNEPQDGMDDGRRNGAATADRSTPSLAGTGRPLVGRPR